MPDKRMRVTWRGALLAALLVGALGVTVVLALRAARPAAPAEQATAAATAATGAKAATSRSSLGFNPGAVPPDLARLRGPYAAFTAISVEETACYTGVDGNVWVDGTLTNETAQSVTDVSVTVEYRNSAGGTVGWAVIPADCHVIEADSPASAATFSSPVALPPGTDPTQCSFTALGTPTLTPKTEVLLQVEYLPPVVQPVGSTAYDVTVTNTSTVTVSSIVVGGTEDRGTDSGSATFFDALSDITYSDAFTLAPGESADVSIDSPRSTSGVPGSTFEYIWAEAVPYVPLQVFRFYKPSTGTHFYTADPAERDNVINTLGAMYRYEGPAYSVNSASPSNMHPLYRFYNLRTGTHFYTADTGERDNVINTLGYLYHYDGIAYSVSLFDGFSQPVFRFYNRLAGVHFYTADAAERDNVINTMGWKYSYEGPAYYLAY
jgi:hypothetical protein